jgi:hypothetical protein
MARIYVEINDLQRAFLNGCFHSEKAIHIYSKELKKPVAAANPVANPAVVRSAQQKSKTTLFCLHFV